MRPHRLPEWSNQGACIQAEGQVIQGLGSFGSGMQNKVAIQQTSLPNHAHCGLISETSYPSQKRQCRLGWAGGSRQAFQGSQGLLRTTPPFPQPRPAPDLQMVTLGKMTRVATHGMLPKI